MPQKKWCTCTVTHPMCGSILAQDMFLQALMTAHAVSPSQDIYPMAQSAHDAFMLLHPPFHLVTLCTHPPPFPPHASPPSASPPPPPPSRPMTLSMDMCSLQQCLHIRHCHSYSTVCKTSIQQHSMYHNTHDHRLQRLQTFSVWPLHLQISPTSHSGGGDKDLR